MTDPTPAVARRCILWHRWSAWRDTQAFNVRTQWGGVGEWVKTEEFIVQERRCADCGKLETRREYR